MSGFWQKQQMDFPAWVSYAKPPIQMRDYVEFLVLLSAEKTIIIPYTDLPPYTFQNDSILSFADCNNWQSNKVIRADFFFHLKLKKLKHFFPPSKVTCLHC